MYRLALALLFAAAAVSCDPTGPTQVEVRVENASGQLMADVVIGFPESDVDYGDVGPGAVTGYREVGLAYRYAAVRTVVAGDTLGLIPVDYVGETPLDPGHYTYRLGLFEGRNLTLELVRD